MSLEFFKTKGFNENGEEILLKERVDHYWGKTELMKNSAGDFKLPLINKFIKAARSLAHGNAEVKRGLSESAKNVTKNRILLSEASINAIQSTKDFLKSVNKQPHTVPITKEFIQFGRSVHCAYNLWQEEERQVADEKERKKKGQGAKTYEKESRSIFERKRKSQHKVCYR